LWLAHNDLWIARNNHLERLDATEPQSEPALSFLDAICHGAAELAPPECARPVFHLTQAILKSSRAGRIVTLD
jgi:predicted dehydrogenase